MENRETPFKTIFSHPYQNMQYATSVRVETSPLKNPSLCCVSFVSRGVGVGGVKSMHKNRVVPLQGYTICLKYRLIGQQYK